MDGEVRQSVYENAVDLIARATEQYDEPVLLNRDTTQKLSAICELVERLMKRVDCDCCELNVLIDTMQVIITLVCDEVILSRHDSVDFYKLISMVDSFSFIRHGSETLRIEFRLDHVWRK